MSNPRCAICGHVNRAGAAVCEMCDSRLGEHAPPAEGFNPYGEETREGAAPADIPSPQFKGAGDVISPTLEVFRKNFMLVGTLVAVTTLPFALMQFGVTWLMTPQAEDVIYIENGSLFGFALTAQLLTGLLYFAGNALLSGSLVYAVVELQRTGAASAGESLRRGLRVLPKVFLVTLLYTVITTIGYLLLIVPGVIFSLMYAVAVPVAVLENRGPIESLKRSAALTDGYRGLIFMTYFLWGLVILVLNFVVSGSFAYSGAQGTLPAHVVEALVGAMLSSSVTVLTVYIFLGVLQERSHGFETRTFTPGPEPAAR